MSPLQAPMAGCNSSSRDMASISTEHTCTNPYSDMYVYMYTFINYYFMRGCFTYMYICAPMGMPDPWGPERVLGPLELESEMIIRYHVSAGNQIPGLLEKQPVLLTVELPFQSHTYIIF